MKGHLGEDSPVEFIHPDEMAFGSIPDKPKIVDPVGVLDQESG